MIERKVDKLGSEVSRASLFLSRNFSSAITVERSLEKKSLDLKRKIVEERGRTLKAIGSKGKDSGISGGIGGALGLLGIGTTRRLFRPRVPNTPNQLLRMQKGTSNLSRVSKVGRLAKPLAVVGTGLDFIGRKAEGQTNVQAGVGAAGGLAGSLAGAKYGAILGTSVGGPIGTVIGGAGGAIVGGLLGGFTADLFTGANKRRKFEEERAVARTQRTLFANSLDDFDRVLDKLEGLSPSLILKRDDDDGLPEKRFPFGSFFPKPKPKTPWYKQPAVEITGYTALLLGAIALGGITGEESIPFLGLLKALGKTKAGAFIIKKSPFLARFAKKTAPFADDALVPGKQIPGISKKGLEIRGDKILRDLGTFVKKQTPKVTKGRTKIKNKKVLKNQDKVTFSDKVENPIIKAKPGEVEAQNKLLQKLLRNLEKLKDNSSNTGRKIKKKQLNIFRQKKIENPTDVSDLGEPQSNDIALAPTNNIFLINQSEGDTIQVTSDNTPATMSTNGISAYSAAAKYAEFTASLTA